MASFDTRKLSLTASLAAVYTIFRLIPLDRFIGISGFITASGVATPIIGVLIEPEYGILAVLIGTLVASLAPWNPLGFDGLGVIPGMMNILVVGFALRGRRTISCLVFAGVVTVFSLTPYTRVFVGANLGSPPLPYFWMHLVALAVLASPVSRNLGAWIRSDNYSRVALSVGIVAFAGTMVEHLSGGILYALFFGPGAVKLWPAIYLVYPIERAAIVAGAVVLCSPLIRSVKAIREGLLPNLQSRSLLGLRDRVHEK